MDDLAGYEVLLGVTGGIAAYKSAMLCSMLVQRQVKVTVAMTENAGRFVGPITFSTISGRKVYRDLFESRDIYEIQHIALTERADLIVIAPATANIIAKMAAGICDNLLSTLLAAAECNILIAPAMNARMWKSPTAQRNVAYLKQIGCHFIGPATGRLACGDEDIGRMCEPGQIMDKVAELLKNKPPKNNNQQ